MSRSPISDARERELALDITQSCCVQAPAGSGKTELLTQRILKLLAVCERPEEVLAITFTRKAAAEMRNRLLDNLEEAAHISAEALEPLPDHKRQTLALARAVLAQDEARQWSLLTNTSRLRINTIDSFNQFLVNQLPVTSTLGLLPDITEKPGEIYREAVHETLAQLDTDHPIASELRVLLLHLNNRWAALEKLLCGLLEKRDQWLSYILEFRHTERHVRQRMEQTLADIVRQNLLELDTALSPYRSRLLPVLQFAVHNLASESFALTVDDIADSLPLADTRELGKWQALLALLVTKEFAIRKDVRVSEGFPAKTAPGSSEEKAQRTAMKAEMKDMLATMATDARLLIAVEAMSFVPASRFEDGQWRVLESLINVLLSLVSHLSLAFAHQGKTDYNHVGAAALDALGHDDQPTDLALRLDYQLRHILVDEFQDTSTQQIRLLSRLTRGWQPGDGRTLFIVGDGMQSCYGFRNARVGLFLDTRDNGIGDIRFRDLRLTCNFRSEAAVVEWVNSVFCGAFPPQDDISRGGVSYNPATAVHASTDIAGVKTVLISHDKNSDIPTSAVRHQEAVAITDTITDIRASHPTDSIAVLVRGKSHLADLIPVLRERGLAWQASDIDPLLSYPVIRDLFILTRALLNPADTPAWLALIRLPMVGLRLADMEALVLAAEEAETALGDTLLGYAGTPTLSGEAATILARIRPVLRQAIDQRQRLPLRDWVENTWMLLGGPATLPDATLTENTEQYFRLLEDHDDSGDIRDIHLFEAELGALFGSGQQQDAPVQIMTIHKAKGLEFDHVLIPGLDRQPRGNDNPLLLWKEHIGADGSKRLVMSLPSRRARNHESDPVYHYLKCELELEQRLESTRLMYIGVTRAIRQCILFACVQQDDKGLVEPVRSSLLARLWPQLLPQLETGDCRVITLDEHAPAANVTTFGTSPVPIRLRRLPPHWHNPVTLLPVAAEAIASSDSSTEQPESRHLLERKIGDIVHFCLQQASLGRLDLAKLPDTEGLVTSWRQQLLPVTDDVDSAITNIRAQLKACTEEAHYAWLVLEPHEGAGSELALSAFSQDRHREVIIDRTFIDSDGVRWIIDYKSSRPRADQAISAFLAEQADRYASQLGRYAALFRRMESRPVRTALFFTALPCFHELHGAASDQFF